MEPKASEGAGRTSSVVRWCVLLGLYALTPFVVQNRFLACLVWLLVLGWLVTKGWRWPLRAGCAMGIAFGSLLVVTFFAGDVKSLGEWDGAGQSLRTGTGETVERPEPPVWNRHVSLATLIGVAGGPGLVLAWVLARRRRNARVEP